MKITAVETVRLGEFPNLVWIRLRTDEGVTGLGETFMGAAAVEAYIHESAAPKLIGRDPIQIEAINKSLINYLGWRGTGVETRGNSAIDIALWDLFGKAIGRPVCEALENSEMSKRSSLSCQSAGRAVADRPLAFSQSVMTSAIAVT